MSEALSFLLGLIALDVLLTAARAALVHARMPQLIEMSQDRPQALDRTIALLEEPRLRIMLRVGAVWVHFLMAGSVGLLFLQLLPGLASIGWVLLVMCGVALLTLGLEYAIEGLVLPKTELWAVRFTWLGRLLDFLLRPLSLIMIRLLGSPEALQRQLTAVTDDELKNWVEKGQPEGSLEKGERKMIYSIFQFGETLCREVMVPRIDVFGLDINTPLPEAIEAVIHSGHSRVPVYADTIDNVLGILYSKDLVRVALGGAEPELLRRLLRPPFFVPEAKKVDELLREMQGRGVHMAVVVDEYGGTAGIVTLEDIVEEIVGEIRDEYDQAEEQLYTQVGPNEYLLQGRMALDDVNDLLGTHLPKDDADTLGGYIYGEVGRVPTGGELLDVDEWTFIVEQVSGRRIRMVRARHKQDSEEKEDGAERRDQAKPD